MCEAGEYTLPMHCFSLRSRDLRIRVPSGGQVTSVAEEIRAAMEEPGCPAGLFLSGAFNVSAGKRHASSAVVWSENLRTAGTTIFL